MGDVGLCEFLRGTDLELEDVYRAGRCFTTILHDAGLREGAPPKASIARALPVAPCR